MPEHATGSCVRCGNVISDADLCTCDDATPDRAALERIVEDREADVREFEERLLFVRRRLMAAKLDLAVARDAEQGIDHA